MDKDTIWEARVGEEPVEEEDPSAFPPQDDEHRSMVCRRCHLPRVFQRRATRHRLHFALALGTLGLWLPAWGLVILVQRFMPWKCSACGGRQWEP